MSLRVWYRKECLYTHKNRVCRDNRYGNIATISIHPSLPDAGWDGACALTEMTTPDVPRADAPLSVIRRSNVVIPRCVPPSEVRYRATQQGISVIA